MSFTGRIDRRTFILSQIVLVPLLYVTFGFFFRALATLDSDFPVKDVPRLFRDMSLQPGIATAVAWIAGLASIVGVIAALSFFVRRLHDLDFSGWFILLWPFLTFVISGFDPSNGNDTGPLFEAFLIMVPGISGTNDHGPDPRPLAVGSTDALDRPA